MTEIKQYLEEHKVNNITTRSVAEILDRMDDGVHTILRRRVDSVSKARFNGFSYNFEWVWVLCPDTQKIVKVRDDVSENHSDAKCKCGALLPGQDDGKSHLRY